MTKPLILLLAALAVGGCDKQAATEVKSSERKIDRTQRSAYRIATDGDFFRVEVEYSTGWIGCPDVKTIDEACQYISALIRLEQEIASRPSPPPRTNEWKLLSYDPCAKPAGKVEAQ